MSAFFLAPKIATGPDALAVLRGLDARRVGLLVDPALDALGWGRRVAELLAHGGTEAEVARSDGREPSLASVEAVAEGFRRYRPDWIVALGGGRVIETARAAWVRYARPDLELDAVTPLTELDLRQVARFAAVPSTIGSGADAGWTALVRRPDGGVLELASRELVPDWSLLDPALPVSLPGPIAAEGGAELVAQALEALLSAWANPFSDALAREALEVAFARLPPLPRRPDDAELRGELQHAATFAGLAAANAQLGAAHALAVALGGEEDAPSHGRLLGVLLPYVAEFDYPSVRDRLARFAPLLGASAGKDRSALTERLRALFLPLGIPRTLADAGLSPSTLTDRRDRIVARARASTATGANPRVATAEEYGRLLAAAYDGVAVMF